MKEFDLPGQNKIFVNKNLCPYYKDPYLGKINSFFISGDTIKIKVSENSLPLSITHVDDFGKYFLDVELSPSGRSI